MRPPRFSPPKPDRHVFIFRVDQKLWDEFRRALESEGRIATRLFVKWIEDFLRDYRAENGRS